MAVDKIDPSPLSEQAENTSQAEGIEKVRDSVRATSFVESLLKQKAKTEKVSVASEVDEVQTFSKKDIVELIVLFAMDNELDLDKIQVTKIIKDEQGRLLTLEVESPTSNGRYQLISYMINGVSDHHQSGATRIDRSFWDKDDMPEGGSTVAEYKAGKWVFES